MAECVTLIMCTQETKCHARRQWNMQCHLIASQNLGQCFSYGKLSNIWEFSINDNCEVKQGKTISLIINNT